MVSTSTTLHVSKYNGKIFKCPIYINKLQFYY